jgi:DNA gyrase subunit A
VEAARAKIMKRYKLSEPQATAILDMQLRRLAALERKKIDVEYKEVSALIKDLEGLLKSSKRMRALAGEELRRISAAFADRRRTQIVHVKAGKSRKAMDVQESLPDQPIWVGIAANGRMARTHDDKPPKLTGADAPRFLVRLNTTDVLYLASVGGTAAAVSVNNIPESDKLADGVPFFKVSPLRDGDTLAAAFSLPARRALLPPEACLLTVTRAGLIKKTLVSELLGPSAQTFTLARVNEGDGLAATALTDGKKEVLLVTAMGMAIRFAESEVRPMGLVAAGVSGIRLDDKDRVIAVEILPATGEVLLLASDGKAKRVDQKEFPLQGRYGKGVNAWTLPKKVTLAGALTAKGSATVTVHLAKAAPKSTRLEAVGVRKRASTRGDRLVDVKPGDSVVAVTSGWMVERYVQFAKVEQPTKARKAVKASPAKRRSAGKPKRAPRSAPKKKAKARARRVAGKTAK